MATFSLLNDDVDTRDFTVRRTGGRSVVICGPQNRSRVGGMKPTSDDAATQRRIENIFFSDYSLEEPSPRYVRLYDGFKEDITLGLAHLHEQLNRLFKFMNSKAPKGIEGHFNAQESRELIDLRDEVYALQNAVLNAGGSLALDSTYGAALEGADEWLVPSGGSPIPPGFTPVELKWHDPIFWFGEDVQIRLDERSEVELRTEGQGSFARVQSFLDPLYGVRVARKTLVSPSTAEEKYRFKQEFELMNSLNFPYILQVYKLADDERSYTMEYCHSTLEEYIGEQDDPIDFDLPTRRRVSLQFLNGLNYLHVKGICHRDLSYNNILVKRYDKKAVMLKLSDFGFAKPADSNFTKTSAEIFGSIVDPALGDFKNFQPVNDIYVAGFILSYIFTGQKRLLSDGSPLSEIIHKCSDSNPLRRYESVLGIINDIDRLQFRDRQGPVPTA